MKRNLESFEQGLLRLLKNNALSRKFFLMASKTAEMPELAQWFLQGASRRALFRKEIESGIRPGPSKNTGRRACDGQPSGIRIEHRDAFAGEGDHFLLEEAIRSEKQDMEDHVRILGAKGIPGRLAEVLNDQMTQIGLGLSGLEYLDALKYESE
jgi:hypothetical protein